MTSFLSMVSKFLKYLEPSPISCPKCRSKVTVLLSDYFEPRSTYQRQGASYNSTTDTHSVATWETGVRRRNYRCEECGNNFDVNESYNRLLAGG